MDFSQFKSIIEALLFASEVPLSTLRLKEILNDNIENLQDEHIKLAIDELN
jgi:chromosome segregation and condensation protein ScpB